MSDQTCSLYPPKTARAEAAARGRIAEAIIRQAGFLPRSGRGRCALPLTFREAYGLLEREPASEIFPYEENVEVREATPEEVVATMARCTSVLARDPSACYHTV